MTFKPKVAYITGGSSGIGKAFAEAFHNRGIQVVIGGRRANKLQAVCDANPGMKHVEVDVADPNSVQKAWGRVVEMFSDLDCVINNAGLMQPLDFNVDGPIDATIGDQEIDTNLRSVIVSTATMLPHLKAQPSAYLINVSSGLSFVPRAATPVYCATKAAVRSFTVSLRYQLRSGSVRVIEIIPPAVQSDLHAFLGPEGKHVGVPIEDFIRDAMVGLDEGLDEIPVGPQGKQFRAVIDDDKFGQMFEMLQQ